MSRDEGASMVRRLPSRVARYLQASEQIVVRLREELAAQRERYRSLRHDHDTLSRQLPRIASMQAELDQVVGRCEALRRERDALDRRLGQVEGEGQELRRRCDALDRALRRATGRLKELEQENRVLQDKGQELEATVELLTRRR